MGDLRLITDDQLLLIVDVFMNNGCKAQLTAKQCNALWHAYHEEFSITREQVYPAMGLAAQRGFVKITPPREHVLAQRIAAKFGGKQETNPAPRFVESDIRVCRSRESLPHVASHAALVVLELIQLIGRDRTYEQGVHIGLGAGRTTMFLAKYLAQELRRAEKLPRLCLHAMSASFDPEETEKAPEAFFGYFRDTGLDIEFFGMPSPTIVEAERFDERKRDGNVRGSFLRRDEIDIVVTSLASVEDEHGDLNRFLDVVHGGERKLPNGTVGDVHYCPFSAKRPEKLEGLRPMTLFDLDDLKRHLERENKFVVLISGPCHKCGRARSDALLPLVENPTLKVWSHLVVDLDTAERLLDGRHPDEKRK